MNTSDKKRRANIGGGKCIKIERVVSTLLTVVPAAVLASSLALADGLEEPSPPKAPQISHEPESAASFDKRLPPVMPGEQIRDGNRSMSVISTAGEVAPYDKVVRAPQPQDSFNTGGLGGVLVDQRYGGRGPRDRHPRIGEPGRDHFRDEDQGRYRDDVRGDLKDTVDGSGSNKDWIRNPEAPREPAPPLVHEPKVEAPLGASSEAILGDVAPGKGPLRVDDGGVGE